MEEVASVFRSDGLPETTVTSVAQAIRSDRRRWVEVMIKFELGLDKPDPARARRSAGTSPSRCSEIDRARVGRARARQSQ